METQETPLQKTQQPTKAQVEILAALARTGPLSREDLEAELGKDKRALNSPLTVMLKYTPWLIATRVEHGKGARGIGYGPFHFLYSVTSDGLDAIAKATGDQT